MLDQISDTNMLLFNQIVGALDVPDYVKQAAAQDVTALPPMAFAHPVARTFPCHTKASTYLSYAYAAKQASEVPRPVRETLNRFVDNWGIRNDCDEIDRAFTKTSQSLDSLPDDSFAIVQPQDGKLYRALPINTADNVQKAAAHMLKFMDRYPLGWRCQAAERIVKAAQQHDVQLESDYFEKAASTTWATPEALASAIRFRVLLTKRGDFDIAQTQMLKTALALVTAKAGNAAACEQAIDTFDRMHDLHKRYGSTLQPPEVVCRQVVVKQASDETIRLANNRCYTKQALSSAPVNVFGVLGPELVAELTVGIDTPQLNLEKAADILPTLPLPDAKLLTAALSEAGITHARTA